MFQTTFSRLCVAAGLALTPALAQKDFGLETEKSLAARSVELFGIDAPLAAPATRSDYVARAQATATQRVKLAAGLRAEFVTRQLYAEGDMLAFFPATNPTHLIVCIEGGRATGGTNPSVQRVNLTSGSVETILFGMDRCDGIRTTAWGTVLATEETDDGRAYEILNPLNTTGHWVDNRSTGLIRTTTNGTSAISLSVAQRQALPTLAWEGLEVLPSGVTIAGDELRPGTGKLDSDGGAIFKFVPDNPRPASAGPIGSLNQSPLIAGRTYAMVVSCTAVTGGGLQYGQGCEVGTAVWVRVDALKATADANAKGATGYYRPEDLHLDPIFKGTGVRFCWANTGNGGARNYAEVVCGVDGKPTPASPREWRDARTGFDYLADGGTAASNLATVEVNRFLEGDARFNAHDNLEFQPETGILYVIEDATYGEVFACLPDGADRDIKSDGCIGVLSVVDPDAEPTGFIFDSTGRTAYVIIQHGEQAGMGVTDDLLRITGFKAPAK